MNRTEVRKDGQHGRQPGRDAMTGAAGAVPGAPRRDGAAAVGVERIEASGENGYYGQPVLNAPVWESREIAGYFFLGGLAGAGSTMAALAAATGRPTLATGLKLSSAAAAGVSVVALVRDLGVPARFYNMVRVFRPTSPMSVGSWLLAGYVPAALVAAGSATTGRLPRTGLLATGAAAVLGPAVATYTAALVTDTAVPAWHDGHREMPLLFAASATSAAAGMGLVVAPSVEASPVRALALAATTAEMLLERSMPRRMGAVGDVYHQGRAGSLGRASRALALGGLGLAVAGRRSRPAAIAAGLALVASSALTRFSVFHAGMQSARDPAATLRPQRERLSARALRGQDLGGTPPGVDGGGHAPSAGSAAG